MFSSALIKKLRIDDPLDAFSVHGACGVWGVVATGFFGVHEYICGDAAGNCITMGGQTAMQFVGVILIILWTGVLSVILFAIMRVCGILRANAAAEINGLDMNHHNGYTGILRYREEMELTTGEIDVHDFRFIPVNNKSVEQKVERKEELQ